MPQLAVDEALNLHRLIDGEAVRRDDPRTDGRKTVETLAAVPLLVLVLDGARAHIVEHGVAKDIVQRLVRADVVRIAADDDGQLRLIVEIGDDVAVAVDAAAGRDGLVHALGKIDREHIGRLDALAGDGLAFLRVVKIVDAEADDILRRMRDGGEQFDFRHGDGRAALCGLRVKFRPASDERRHVRTARNGVDGSVLRPDETDGGIAVLPKCCKLHRLSPE